MLIKSGEEVYEESEPLQKQLPLGDEAQEEFNFAEANPVLYDKLKTSTEERRWLRVEVEEVEDLPEPSVWEETARIIVEEI